MTIKEEFEQLPLSWKEAFVPAPDAEKAEFETFLDELDRLYEENPEATPARENVFRVFRLCPFESVSVVFLGQDPYPNKDWACGLAFAFGNEDRPQQSLANIFTELELEGFSPAGTSLTGWVEQGVLLMNTSLTFVPGRAELIDKWRRSSSRVLEKLSENKDTAFLLLGSAAQKAVKAKGENVFKAGHPSNLYQTSRKYFFPQADKTHDKRCNAFLKSHGKPEIDWSRTK